MNYRLVCRLLGLITVLIAVAMVFSLPWAFPSLGVRHNLTYDQPHQFEANGFYALATSIVISTVLGGLLLRVGGPVKGDLFHKEAMAVVGLTWLLATVLGGLPFYISGTALGPSLRVGQGSSTDYVYVFQRSWWKGSRWVPKFGLSYDERAAVSRLIDAGSRGVPREHALQDGTADTIAAIVKNDASLHEVLMIPGINSDGDTYSVVWAKMGFIDAMFESQSGFSTTGATVISDLENPSLVPHCILFWRSSTHFLGGLGIIVLFVVILGQGSAGKALMRNEVPGPSQEGPQARMQHTAWVFAGIYVALNFVLTILLKAVGLTWFDALCHAFGTMATGGFSTYNASLGHFSSATIDYIVIAFMLLAGMNFTLLYFLLLGQPLRMLRDAEWRTYIGAIMLAATIVVVMGYVASDFTDTSGQASWTAALRYGLFQVVSIVTTTGFGTHDFDSWNSLGKCVLLILMFVGGCAGSTGGGVKVIRWLLLSRILGRELERAHRPRVVRPLMVGNKVIDDPELPANILVYFSMIAVLFLGSWLFVVGIEPDTTWAGLNDQKLIDSASAVVATLNNIGPGLGTVGATQNYGHLCDATKLLFTFLMMLGRVEVFAILVLLTPSFWRTR